MLDRESPSSAIHCRRIRNDALPTKKSPADTDGGNVATYSNIVGDNNSVSQTINHNSTPAEEAFPDERGKKIATAVSVRDDDPEAFKLIVSGLAADEVCAVLETGKKKAEAEENFNA